MRSLPHSALTILPTNNTEMGFRLLCETPYLCPPPTMILTMPLTLTMEHLARGTTMLRLSAPMRSLPFIEKEGELSGCSRNNCL